MKTCKGSLTQMDSSGEICFVFGNERAKPVPQILFRDRFNVDNTSAGIKVTTAVSNESNSAVHARVSVILSNLVTDDDHLPRSVQSIADPQAGA